jgi:predicted RND superfamily exporter protein
MSGERDTDIDPEASGEPVTYTDAETNTASTRTPERLAGLLVDHRRVVFVVVFALVIAASVGVVVLEEESGFGDVSLGTDEEADLEYVQSNFAAESSDREVAQVVVQEENVFEKETLIRTLELQQSIRSHPSVEPTLAEERETAGIANVLATAAYRYRHGDDAEPTLDEQVATLDGLSQQEVDLLVEQLLGNKGGSSEALAFLPEGYEPGSPHASATMIVVFQTVDEEYPGSAAPKYVVESHLAIQSLGEESELDTLVVGNGIFTDEEQRALDDTMSLIGPVALVLVVLVLALAYRDVLDVLLGLAGIVLVQLWTFGTLGWLGIPFNPILVAVPVLLIGLSIDYCIHVFMRYRESRDSDGHRSGIDGAMRAGLAGIGVALVWVTVTTSVGFLSNLVSPVGPIRDLGLVAAIGIVGSFVVFVLLVPPLKVELDTQLERFGLDRRNPPIGTGGGRIGELLSVGATAAQRAPVVVVLVVVFRVVHGSATLGVVTLLPVTAAVSWIIGTMYLLGYPLSILNTIIASLTIGIGIDYSIHVTERFRAELAQSREIESAVATTVRGTGGALLGSAATTAVGFGVLALAIHPPLRQFGAITAIMIGYAFLGAVLVLPSLLVLWARYRDRDPLGIGLDIYGTGRP